MSSSLETLDLLRRAHAGASRRAAAAWSLVTEIARSPVLVGREAGLRKIAEAIFYNSGYDACERYESVEEFLESLTEDVDATWKERTVVEGVEHYVLRPFFYKSGDYVFSLGLGYLRGCSREELTALDTEVSEYSGVEPVGLSLAELGAVVAFHHRKTLAIVNALRHLSTALNYVKLGLDKYAPDVAAGVPLVVSPGVREAVNELDALATLPLEPAPLKFFGTEADRVNPLRTLPLSAKALGFLMADAAAR